MSNERTRIDPVTIIGLGLILMPLLTMWHEIGGHAAACVAVGGQVKTIGAFYLDCDGVAGVSRIIVACAGVAVDTALAIVAFALWRRAAGNLARLTLWYVWVTKAFVAAGYFCFSGVSGVGDLGPGIEGGIGPLPMPWLWRAALLAIGALAYWRLIVAGIRTLTEMLGDAAATRAARKRIAHVYYGTMGVVAVLVGLLNPVGLFITIMSAAASSFGGNAGFISIGFAGPAGATERGFVVGRNWALLLAGMAISGAFAVVLGPSMRF
jgi:hypothetical protein